MPSLPNISESDVPDEPTNGNSTDDSHEIHSDVSSELEEILPAERPAYFRTEFSRLFHSHGDLPYPLPCDAPELERQNVFHRVLQQVLGSNFVGPVHAVLASDTGERGIKALDIGNGNGIWLEEMSEQFPHVKFHGIDIVPVSSRTPPRNVDFEMHNMNEALRRTSGTMSFVHARSIDMAVTNYPALLNEVARILRPGGLFLSGEWSWGPTFQDGARRNTNPIPAIDSFVTWITDELYARNHIAPAGAHVHEWLSESGQFIDISETLEYCIPLDHNTDTRTANIGTDFRNAWRWYADSLLPFMRSTGMAEDRVAEMNRGYMRELDATPGLVAVYTVTYATKSLRGPLVAGR
ncbi:hypothetical protein FIBSPDRAFT_1036313 [Athelia psychrophila]|uniref:S-adenosyl-L-methionine-dependent methyltransferase n=1 Tax=Athelia psychrophila TaxID=1759441 RepID=A0A166VYJ2_9AGAM|nr:hypothetical protein FIBSPDRAFT_1036313 [Fibularhizoctonia sp. CBS 109695]